MKLTPVQIKTLLYVLKDVASKAELDHQLSDGHAADELVELGLLHTHAGFYSITAKGREVAAAERKDATAVKLSKPAPVYVAKAPERISINKSLDIAELSRPQSIVFKAATDTSKTNPMRSEAMNAVVEKIHTNAVHERHTKREVVDVVIAKNQILKTKLYELFPYTDSGKKRIQKDVFDLLANGTLKEESGVIRVGENIKKYLARANKNTANQSSKEPSHAGEFKLVDTADIKGKKHTKAKPVESVVDKPDDELHIPTFLRKESVAKVVEAPVPQLSDTPAAEAETQNPADDVFDAAPFYNKDKPSLTSKVETIHAEYPREAIVFPEPTANWGKIFTHPVEEIEFSYDGPQSAVDTFEKAREETRLEIQKHLGSSVRFALTSDKTLMLMGLDQPVELSKGDTVRLIDFCEEISMTLVCEVESPEIAKHQAVLELCQSLMQFDPKELYAQIQAKAMDAATKMQGLKL